jgi:hypothetical protein
MARRLPLWTALLLPFLLTGVGTAAAASPPHDECPVPTIVESVLGTRDTCSTLDLGNPVGVMEVRYLQGCAKTAKELYVCEFVRSITIPSVPMLEQLWCVMKWKLANGL